MYICILMRHHFWLAMECQMSNTVQPQYVYWLLLYFLIHQSSVTVPPVPSSSCKRAPHKRARSQTLKDIGRLCCARQHRAPPQTWTCLAAGTVAMVLMNARWAETCPQSTHCSITTSIPSPCLSWQFLNLMEEKITNYKSSEVPDSIFICLNE